MQAQKPQQKYIIMLDTSGSVGGSKNYWTTVNDILAMYANDIEKYYFWNTSIEEIKLKRYQQAIQEKKGWGGTSPQLVAQECVKKGYKNIILITDGQVGDHDVQKCDKILSNYKFNKTICYIIGPEYSTNMSVTCPFSRNCANKVYTKDQTSPIKEVVSYTPEDYKILDTLDTITLANFEAQYDTIEGLIIALNMGKEGNIPLKNDLVLMKNRLVKELSKQKAGDKKDLSQQVRDFLLKGDFGGAIKQFEIVCKSYFADDMTVNLEKKISHLINLCGDLRGKYNLNDIKSNKMATAKDAQQGQIDKEVEVTDLSNTPIECPILNDDDVPQILVDECDPVLLGVEKSIVDDIAACPLRILNYPDIKAKLKSKLSNFIGVMGIKAKFDKDLYKNPFTQNRLLGGIPLGSHASHVKVGNYTIAKLISGGKILGNLNLYYAVIWSLIKEGEIEYLKEIEKNATEHLIFRLKESKTYASLCGQAQFVTTMVDSDIAVWYCVNSGYLNQPTDRDTFRFHYYNLDPMMKIVEALGYPNDKGLMPHYYRTKNLLNLLSIFKAMKSHSHRKTFKNMLLGLYQNGIFLNVSKLNKKFAELEMYPQFIPVDGPASEEQVAKIREKFGTKYKFTKDLTDAELFYIGNLVDPQKSASNIFLDYNLKVPELPKPAIQWKYGLEKYVSNVKMCSKTLRPYYHVEQNQTWQQAAEKKFKMKREDFFSGYKYYEAFLAKYQFLPQLEELIIFYYNRYVEAGKCKTLPFLAEQWSYEILTEYQQILKNIPIKDVLKKLDQTRKIENRIEIEKAE